MNATDLRAELHELRTTDPRSPRIPQLFEAWFAQACKEGHPPDRLRLYSPVESERFWARTVPGPDGHTYWTGGKMFSQNRRPGLRNLPGITPRRWVWIRSHGSIPMTDSVSTTCGEPNCVTLEHLKCERREGLNSWVPDERMLGRLQVVAMELGHTPTVPEWGERGETPSYETIRKRFGSWGSFCRAAGLDPTGAVGGPQPTSTDACIASIRYVAEQIGHAPSSDEYREFKRTHVGDPPLVGKSTLSRRLDHIWAEALRKAGL